MSNRILDAALAEQRRIIAQHETDHAFSPMSVVVAPGGTSGSRRGHLIATLEQKEN